MRRGCHRSRRDRSRCIGFQKKNGFPIARITRSTDTHARTHSRTHARERAFDLIVIAVTRCAHTFCRARGSNCHACFKESRAFQTTSASGATLRGARAVRSRISIIRCNNVDFICMCMCVESRRVEPLKKYSRWRMEMNCMRGNRVREIKWKKY